MTVYLDFDGTVVEHQYPQIGRCNFGGYKVIKALQEAGYEIILNTYRADLSKEALDKALDYVNRLWGMVEGDFETNLTPIAATNKKLHPQEWDMQTFMQTEIIYIDDSSQKSPLKPAVMSAGYMVDWAKIEFELKQFGAI